MPELPKSIRVGYRTYTVTEMDPRVAEAEGNYGWHSGLLCEIQVRTDGIAQPEVADSLIHEVLHAAYQLGGLKFDDSEERIVTVLAQLTQVWRDNSAFVAFMTESLSE